MSDQKRTTPIGLSGPELQRLRTITLDGTTNFAEGYREISRILADKVQRGVLDLDADTNFFFTGAAPVNANDPLSAANIFIRTLTAAGFAWDGLFVGEIAARDAQIQSNSDGIGRNIFQEIFRVGGVPTIDSIVANDARTAVTDVFLQTIGGWGGAARYWDIVWQPDTGKTVGQSITESPAQLEKFIAVNAKALAETFGRELAGQPWFEFERSAFWRMYADSPLSSDIQRAIIVRALEGMITGNYAGNPNVVNGWSFDQSSGQWVDVAGRVADTQTATSLDAIRSIRQSHQGVGGFSDVGIDGTGGTGFIDEFGNITLQFPSDFGSGGSELVFDPFGALSEATQVDVNGDQLWRTEYSGAFSTTTVFGPAIALGFLTEIPDVVSTVSWAGFDLEDVPQFAFTLNDGIVTSIAIENSNGSRTAIEQNTGFQGDWLSRTTTYWPEDGQITTEQILTRTGAIIRRDRERGTTEVERPERPIITGAQIGSIVGSSLGQLIGGENVFAQVAAGSALATALSAIGAGFDRYFGDTTGDLSVFDAITNSFSSAPNIGTAFAQNIRTQGIGALSSFLTAELAESLGVNSDSFGEALFSYAAAAIWLGRSWASRISVAP